MNRRFATIEFLESRRMLTASTSLLNSESTKLPYNVFTPKLFKPLATSLLAVALTTAAVGADITYPTLWTTLGPGGGGSYFSANINGQDLWVASDMSDLFHSANFGQSWQLQNFHTINAGGTNATNAQVQFTSDPNILYIPASSLGVAKSTNAGATWTKLSAWTGGTAYWMAADPTSTSKILVASASKIYISTNGGSTFTTAYTSSTLYVAGAFFDGNNVYIGTNKGMLVSTNGGTSFTVSTTTGIASGQFIISFTGAKEGTTTRLMAITSASNPTTGDSARSSAFGKLYRLDVGGTWIDKTTSFPTGNKPHFVQMARNNISTIYLAGTDAGSFAYPQVLKSIDGGNSWTDVYLTSTTDGGGLANKNIYTGYENLGGDFDYGWGGGPWSFVVSSSDPNRAMMVDSGFIHVTSDGGATWHQAYANPAYENPAAQSIPKHKAYATAGSDDTSVHTFTWTSPTNIIAGYTDTIGWVSADGGTSWANPVWYTTANNTDNNTVYKTELASDGKVYAATSYVHDMYQSNYLLDSRTNPSGQNGRITLSTNGGTTWSLIHEFSHPVVWEQIDPNNPNRMYAMVVDGIGSGDSGSAGGIWVTNNLNLGAASTWTKLTNPPRTQGHPYILRVLNDGTLVATYSGRRAVVSGTEVFTDSSGVFVSTDSGATWIDRSAANMHWYTKDVVIDPTDPTQNTWYATVFNGWSGTGNDLGDLYRTTNRGVTWTKMGLNSVVGAISLDVSSVTINPATKEMYVATGEHGILYTPDVTKANLASSDFSDLTSFPFAWTERVFINPYNAKDVWVASFGGGIKRGGVGPGGLGATPAGTTQINLTWNDNSANEAGFEIDRATDSNFSQNLVTTTAAMNATASSITGLNAGTTYYFRVRAVSGGNSSANSATASVSTAAPDTTSPAVSSIIRGAITGTSVSWNVTFSEPVTGVDAGDFSLATSLTGAIITGVTGSGASYNVTASIGLDNGSIGLNLVDDDSIIDPAANKLGGIGTGNGNFIGQVFSIDHSTPVVSFINSNGATTTSASSVSWTIGFSKPVTGVDASDFLLSYSGLAGPAITNVTGSGDTWIVTVSTGTGSGSLRLKLIDDDSIIDLLNQPLGGSGAGNANFTGATFIIDRTPPEVYSITAKTSLASFASNVSWTVMFLEPVFGVDTADFSLNSIGLTGATITSVIGSGTTWLISASTGSGSGSLGLNLIDNDSIQDGIGNVLGGVGVGNGSFAGDVYTIRPS